MFAYALAKGNLFHFNIQLMHIFKQGNTPLFIAACFPFFLNAQNTGNQDLDFVIDETAMLRLVDANGSPASMLNFHLLGPVVPGQGVPSIQAQSSYLQYTSVKGASPDDIRQIDVEIVGGALPSGVQLTVSPSLNGTGTMGTGSPITLTSGNLHGTLITGIKSAYTGDGPGDGALLTYALNFATQNLDAATSGIVTLRYTLSNS